MVDKPFQGRVIGSPEKLRDMGDGTFALVVAGAEPSDGVSAFSREPPVNANDRSAAASTTSATFAPANPVRMRVIIQNLDAAINIFVNLGGPATTGRGSLKIPPGQVVDLTGTKQAVNIIASSGAPDVTVWEF